MAVNAAQAKVKTVGDPSGAYESLVNLWRISRAVCSGERHVKEFDHTIDVENFTNLLIPFSPSMTQEQYDFYKAEAELPGITAQFSKMIVGGLLRKQPLLTLPEDAPDEAHDWIMSEFGVDDSPLTAFLDDALWEEVQTSRAWIFVDFPKVENTDDLDNEDRKKLKPYPILQKAENIINWQVRKDAFGKTVLGRVIVRGYELSYTDDNEFHPVYKATVWVHELNAAGNYQIRIFQREDEENSVGVVTGQEQQNNEKLVFKHVDTISEIKSQGKYLRYIPAWPLNGNIDASEPLLSAIIDKEISLYNKISRRNHLLYGAATYTPIIQSDMGDDDFEKIVNKGLGTWIKIGADDKADVLKTPTEALKDMDRAIASSIEEMAKLGIRMLTPETAQSGVALEIRNAAQTAQLGTLNSKISNIMASIIAAMINWRYGTEYKGQDIKFSLSEDFNPIPIGADWLRLATEWYENGLIPRSVWLQILKSNDLIPPDFNDEDAVEEINNDELVNSPDTDESDPDNKDFINDIEKEDE